MGTKEREVGTERERERKKGKRERLNVTAIRGEAALKDGQDLGELSAWSRHYGGRTLQRTRLAVRGQRGARLQHCLVRHFLCTPVSSGSIGRLSGVCTSAAHSSRLWRDLPSDIGLRYFSIHSHLPHTSSATLSSSVQDSGIIWRAESRQKSRE